MPHCKRLRHGTDLQGLAPCPSQRVTQKGPRRAECSTRALTGRKEWQRQALTFSFSSVRSA
uniref:Uncharacterized protein n=1 Tax=Aureimonas frigidaquae TaxID=424757 RepID=A0A0P0Z4S5_9HYPH|nr:hypothetical protein [Aureimonas frigidaquae]